jgi:hypothetical protein
VEQSRLHVLEPTFFSSFFHKWIRERALPPPTHPLAHRGAWRRRAGRGSSAPPLGLGHREDAPRAHSHSGARLPSSGKAGGASCGAVSPHVASCCLVSRVASCYQLAVRVLRLRLAAGRIPWPCPPWEISRGGSTGAQARTSGPDFSGHNEGATKCTGARARPEPCAAKPEPPDRRARGSTRGLAA